MQFTEKNSSSSGVHHNFTALINQIFVIMKNLKLVNLGPTFLTIVSLSSIYLVILTGAIALSQTPMV